MSILSHLLDATISIGGSEILWREIIGNVFGMACAWGGMKRKVWAWPIGIIGNVLLFTVFLGGVFHTPQALDLYGQAGRQVMFILVSVYGWAQWSAARRRGLREKEDTDLSRSIVSTPAEEADAVQPRWASPRERLWLLIAAAVGFVLFGWIFGALGSWGPWAESWIFVGSILATYGMAKGLTEFWLIWIGVDVVGVPLLLTAGYYPSAVLYLVYAGFVLSGFFVWVRTQREAAAARVEAA